MKLLQCELFMERLNRYLIYAFLACPNLNYNESYKKYLPQKRLALG